ncbi:hypothetical protein INS49_007779 [Diaporthe citri]|uniref:uncharacterized protein n=1 Tax=Diaporthe citri TaxID=83186 RepID=UPI001C7F0CAB|nr:uncharacterized protein INS49_007779 [Diaporthe citri]KAG6362686.1 hypothetical protein INS49_007779 [Diaporthe citri]
MVVSNLMESISRVWPFSRVLELTDEGYFVNPQMSDSDLDTEADDGDATDTIDEAMAHDTATPSAIQSFLSTGWLPGLPGQYDSSPTAGHEGDAQYDDDHDNEPNGTTEVAPISAFSHGNSNIDEMHGQNVLSALEESDSDSQETDEDSTNDTRIAKEASMVENDDLESQLFKHNPWRTLARFRNPMRQADVSLYSRFPILRMPAELLFIVAEHLPIESAACLALACKTTYLALGAGWFRMPKPNLWNFLLIIEHERLNSFACPRCLKLHRPPNSFSGYHSHRCSVSRVLDTGLPDTISPGLVKMIGRKYFEDPRAAQECLSWVTMAAKKTTRHIKLATHVIPRMLDGSLLLRTETYIHPFRNGNLTERSLMEMIYHIVVLCGFFHNKLPPVCDHQEWESLLPNLPTLWKSIQPTRCVCGSSTSSGKRHMLRCYPTKRMFSPPARGLRSPNIACFLTHKQPCKSCKRNADDLYEGEIKGCKKCATDFCISARKVPEVGTCLVLTSWKNIGGVGPGDADNWDRHVTSRRSPYGMIEDDFRSDRQVGKVYKAFENITGGRAGRLKPYSPQTDSKMVRDLTRRVRKYRHNADDTTDAEALTASEASEEDEDSS